MLLVGPLFNYHRTHLCIYTHVIEIAMCFYDFFAPSRPFFCKERQCVTSELNFDLDWQFYFVICLFFTNEEFALVAEVYLGA